VENNSSHPRISNRSGLSLGIDLLNWNVGLATRWAASEVVRKATLRTTDDSGRDNSFPWRPRHSLAGSGVPRRVKPFASKLAHRSPPLIEFFESEGCLSLHFEPLNTRRRSKLTLLSLPVRARELSQKRGSNGAAGTCMRALHARWPIATYQSPAVGQGPFTTQAPGGREGTDPAQSDAYKGHPASPSIAHSGSSISPAAGLAVS
jgi:hypothetical protein